MASICTEGELRRIVFKGIDGKRRSLSLGRETEAYARLVANHVDTLIAARLRGLDLEQPLRPELLQALQRNGVTSRDRIIDAMGWIQSPIGQALRPKLVAVDVIGSQPGRPGAQAPPLGEFLDKYLERRSDSKLEAPTFYSHTIRNLKDFFGDDCKIDAITVGDAKDFFRYLETLKSERGKMPKPLAAVSPEPARSLPTLSTGKSS